MQLKSINSLEKKIFLIAVFASVIQLCFIAFAAFYYGLTVPGCVEGMKPFTKGEIIRKDDKHYEVHVVAKMWAFEPAVIELPSGSTVDFFLSSIDVNHGFQIVGTNVNLMAVPGSVNYARYTFSKPGRYLILCQEYCGLAHQGMFGAINVSDDIKEAKEVLLANYLDAQKVNSSPAVSKAQTPEEMHIAKGKQIFQVKACSACHTVDGSRLIGPSLKGIMGRNTVFTDGTSLKADENYIKESIREPQKKIVKGFESAQMIQVTLTDEEMDALITYLKSI